MRKSGLGGTDGKHGVEDFLATQVVLCNINKISNKDKRYGTQFIQAVSHFLCVFVVVIQPFRSKIDGITHRKKSTFGLTDFICDDGMFLFIVRADFFK
jgi:hypothetical protein